MVQATLEALTPVHSLLIRVQSPLQSYLWSIGGHQKGIGPARMVVIVHGRSSVQRHQLQSGIVGTQYAVGALLIIVPVDLGTFGQLLAGG